MVNQTAYKSLRQHAPRLALALLFQPERQKATLATLLLLGLEFDRIAAQVSEPMLAESKFKDVDTAAPDEEPPGARVLSIEFGGVAVLGLIPNPENASSVICVLLSETMPDNEAF